MSKLKIATNDPNLSDFEEKEHIYTIKSISSKLKYDEQKMGFYPYISKDTIISKYVIKDNKFLKIKSSDTEK